MANKRIRGITIEIGGDTLGLDKALQGTEKQISSLSGELREIERGLELDPGNMELLGMGDRVNALAS